MLDKLFTNPKINSDNSLQNNQFFNSSIKDSELFTPYVEYKTQNYVADPVKSVFSDGQVLLKLDINSYVNRMHWYDYNGDNTFGRSYYVDKVLNQENKNFKKDITLEAQVNFETLSRIKSTE